MNLIIYNINSFGGNYEYVKYLFAAYQSNQAVQHCTLLMPENAVIKSPGVHKVLLTDTPSTDNKWLRKVHFFYRSIVNPLRLFSFLKKQPSAVVLFNDFDQVTAWIWAPLYRLLKKKHTFAVMLHDPDRDQFFTLKQLSTNSMQQIMSFMDIAFYHGFLPDKPYYKGNFLKVQIPHGIYENEGVDGAFSEQLFKLAKGRKLLGILGNIRKEKNYEIVINALQQLEGVALLVAGKAASSAVSIEYFKQYAAEKEVEHKLIWIDEYLDQAKFNATIYVCDIVLLYYQPSFTSQSGVLNTIAPFKKKLIVSDIQSSLTETVKQYNLAEVVPHNNLEELVLAIKRLLSEEENKRWMNWELYMKGMNWQRHVDIAIENYKKCLHEH